MNIEKSQEITEVILNIPFEKWSDDFTVNFKGRDISIRSRNNALVSFFVIDNIEFLEPAEKIKKYTNELWDFINERRIVRSKLKLD